MGGRVARRRSSPADSASTVALSRARDPFVGRRDELGALQTAVRSALDGRGGVRIITGEAGVGKTRLAEEVASACDMRVLRGRCSDSDGAPAYWPWIQAIRPLLAESTTRQLDADWGAGMRIAGLVFPELLPGRPDGGRSRRPTDAGNTLWFQVLDVLSRYLTRVARRRPLLILLDDLQWADRRSLDLLRDVTRMAVRERLLVIGTLRHFGLASTHVALRTLGELVKETAFQELPLAGLSLAEVARYLELVGSRASEAIARSVHRLTDGNPLYLGQVARGACLLRGTSSAPLDGVHSAIAGRIATLSPPTLETLEAASLFSGSFRVEQLAEVLGIATQQAMVGVDESVRAHLLNAADEDPGVFEFVHGLVRDCLRADLPLHRRAALHAKIGAVLERTYGSSAGPAAAELMEHFSAALPLLGPEKAATYARDAARHALNAAAWEDAVRFADTGLKLVERRPMDDLKAELVSVRAITHNAATELSFPRDASGPIAAAFEQFERSGNASLALEMIEHLGPLLVAHFGRSFRERALRFAPVSPAERAMVMAACAQGLGNYLDDFGAARAGFVDAFESAEQADDRRLQIRVLWLRATVEHNHLLLERAVETARQRLEPAVSHRDPHEEHHAREMLANWLPYLGLTAEARRHAELAFTIAETLENRAARLGARTRLAWLAFHQGEMKRALELTEQCVAESPPVGVTWWEPRHVRVCIACEAGWPDVARRSLRELLDWAGSAEAGWERQSRRLVTESLLQAAVVAGLTEVLPILRSWIEPALPSSAPANPYAMQQTRGRLALIAWLCDDLDAARELYEALRDERVTPSLPRLWIVRGVLARMLGEMDGAVELLRSARLAVSWSVPYGLHCDHELAVTLSECGAPGDRRRALETWSEAKERADRHGLAAWSERIGAALAQHRAGAAPRGAAGDAGLTTRELEVLRLVAAGRTNKWIAAELSISERTVELHVGKVLAKTGSANRTEAANFAHQHGIG